MDKQTVCDMNISHEVMHVAVASQDLNLNFRYENENGHALHSSLVLPEPIFISIFMYYICVYILPAASLVFGVE